jgi:hypothetical protein
VFRTLYGKLSAVLLLLFIGIGILFILLTLFTNRVHLQEVTQKLNRSLARHIASDTSLIQDGRVKEDAIREIFHMLMAVHPGIEVYLLDKDGGILAYSAPPGKVKRERVSLRPLETFLDGSKTFPILGDDPRSPERRKVFSVSPVPPEGPVQGYLYGRTLRAPYRPASFLPNYLPAQNAGKGGRGIPAQRVFEFPRHPGPV